jgi:hypothetical protein
MAGGHHQQLGDPARARPVVRQGHPGQETKKLSIPSPDFRHHRFVQLRVKAAFGPARRAALRGLDPKLSGRNGALVIPGM